MSVAETDAKDLQRKRNIQMLEGEEAIINSKLEYSLKWEKPL